MDRPVNPLRGSVYRRSDAAEEADFWIVWSPEGDRPPRHRHDSYESARREAERLARENPGRRFYAMMAMSVSSVPTSITRTFTGLDALIPF
jgi:hypothetical protein